MSKQYLVNRDSFNIPLTGGPTCEIMFNELDECEVEVLDIRELYQLACQSGYMTFHQFLIANNYIVIKKLTNE